MNDEPRVTTISMNALLDVQIQHEKHPDTFEAPRLDVLFKVLTPGQMSKICYGDERFWVKIDRIDNDPDHDEPLLWVRVRNNLLQPGLKFDDCIIVEPRHLLHYPHVAIPDGWRATEVQVCIMAQAPEEPDTYILRDADERTRGGPVSSYDVVLRYVHCDDEQEWNPEFEDWEFETEEQACEWADALCTQFGFPDFETV